MSVESVELIEGPSTSAVSRAQAEAGLRRNAAVQKGALYALEQVNGQWVAAIVHEAGPPFGGAPADSDEEAPGPKSEGPDDTVPGADEGGDTPPEPKGDGAAPDSDGEGEGHEKKEHGELAQLIDAVHQIAEALGVPINLGAGPVPGADGADTQGGPPGPPVPGAAPPPPPGPGGPHGAGGVQVQHLKSLKPGEVPPGATPAGAPAFSSVRVDHPWAHLVGKTASFQVDSEIGDAPLADIESELQTLAREIGYKVTRFGEGRNEQGARVAAAVISLH